MARKPIVASQVKKIHALKTALLLDDETYRAMISGRFGVRSSKDLGQFQANLLIEEMEEKAVASGKWQRREAPDKPFGRMDCNQGNMATPAQLKKIQATWEEISTTEDPDGRRKALRHILERVAKVSDLRFLGRPGASAVLNALIAMQKRTAKAKRPDQAQDLTRSEQLENQCCTGI